MFKSNKEKELEAEIKRLRDELKDAVDWRENYKKFALGGLTLSDWVKQRTDNEAEFHHQTQKLHLLEKEIEFKKTLQEDRETDRVEMEKIKIENAQLKVKVEMLEKVVDISGEVIDIKDLVSKLIAKMPEIKLDNLTVNMKTEK